MYFLCKAPPLRGGEYLSFAKPALLQARIRSLHKDIGGPGRSRGTKTIGVIVRERGGFHLFDRCALVDHCLNAIADDYEHSAGVCHLALIADEPGYGEDHREARFTV